MKVELDVLNSPHGLCGRKVTLNLNTLLSELRSCVKVEVDVLGFPSLIVRTVSVDLKHHLKKKTSDSSGIRSPGTV